ncbi:MULTISPECIES: hypothetical protein [unclassified Streptomyces]|uniref:hypothetical protein n=1 Tax=unclassified Streptomyces TaxID=2593676 RepID=UPI002E2DBC46|nr:hypothetical protein [Streptomyces sp. NBC_01439]
MRRGLLHAMAWMLATGAAVTLSWWGVHTVMSGTAYDPPLAVPLTNRPLSSSTHGAQASPSPSPTPSASASPSPSGSPTADASPSAGTSPEKSPKPSTAPGPNQRLGQDAGKVQAYPVSGGRVVFSLGASSAELVSATPAADWRMQVWKTDFWIRVTFTRDGREVSVFCTWHDHPPLVEIVDP